MNSEEFLRVYREALDGKVSEQDINDNVSYYRTYINGEIRNGKSEEDVIRGLGDPRLLAKTLEESTKFADGYSNGGYYEYGNDTGRYEDTVGDKGVHIRNIRLPGWLLGILIAIVVIFILAIIFNVAIFLAPYVMLFLIAAIVVKEIKKWINRY